MSGMTLATERPQGIEHVGNEDHPSHGALSRSRSPALRCIFKTEGITTIRTLAKLALYTLAVVTVIDLARYRQRERSLDAFGDVYRIGMDVDWWAVGSAPAMR